MGSGWCRRGSGSVSRRHRDPDYAVRVVGQLYGGSARHNPALARALLHATRRLGPARGYYYQLISAAGWTSLPRLPGLRPPTLILAGDDDPLIPLANARIMHRLNINPAALTTDLIQLLGADQVLHRISDLVRYASDAGPYRYLRRAVVCPARPGTCARSWDTAPAPGGTPRSAPAARAGTGSRSPTGLLIDVRRHWNGMAAEDGRARLRGGAGPGAGPPLPPVGDAGGLN
jgi:hypothetical protein